MEEDQEIMLLALADIFKTNIEIYLSWEGSFTKVRIFAEDCRGSHYSSVGSIPLLQCQTDYELSDYGDDEYEYAPFGFAIRDDNNLLAPNSDDDDKNKEKKNEQPEDDDDIIEEDENLEENLKKKKKIKQSYALFNL